MRHTLRDPETRRNLHIHTSIHRCGENDTSVIPDGTSQYDQHSLAIRQGISPEVLLGAERPRYRPFEALPLGLRGRVEALLDVLQERSHGELA